MSSLMEQAPEAHIKGQAMPQLHSVPKTADGPWRWYFRRTTVRMVYQDQYQV